MISTIKSKQFKIIAALLAVVLVVSCITWNATKVHAMEITNADTKGYTVLGGGSVTGGELKGADGNPANIGVYVTGGSADKYNRNNMLWTHDGNRWSSTDKVLFKNKEQKISAYYPYVQGYNGGGMEYTLTAAQTADSLKADDLLYAAETKLSGEKVSLNFDHLMTKLNVTVKTYGSEISTDAKISKVQIGGLAKTATFKPEVGTFTAGTELTGSTVAYNNNGTYEALVFPAQCQTLTVIVTMDDDRVFTTTVTCPVINAEGTQGLLGDYQYNIEFQVGQDKVTIGGITAESWENLVGGELATE